MCTFADLHVVVIEKDLKSREITCATLESIGVKRENLYCLDTLEDGRETTLDPDIDISLILIDSYGIEECLIRSFLKWNKTNTNVPIILTSFVRGIGLLKYVNLQADAFVSKPINLMTLHRHIKRYITIKSLEERIDEVLKGISTGNIYCERRSEYRRSGQEEKCCSWCSKRDGIEQTM